MSQTNPPSEIPRDHEDHPEMISRASRRGLVLFFIYFALYVLFLLLNVFKPEAMAETKIGGENGVSLGGPNVAIVFGIALIFAAAILSLVYMYLTRKPQS